MPDKGTTKKVTEVVGGASSPSPAPRAARTPLPPPDKGKAGSLRLFAILSWIVAIGLEAGAIFFVLLKPPVNMTLLIVLIAADLIFAVVGSMLWKRANRFDPASQADKLRFFVQNQLGAIISIIAFLPLVILILTNKDMSGKQKSLAGGVAIAALVIAALLGIDFNPPSQEQYAAQTSQVESLSGADVVYWTKSGTRYHIYSDCPHINTAKTDEIFKGTVAQARELKNITELCKTCEARAAKEKALIPPENPPTETQPNIK